MGRHKKSVNRPVMPDAKYNSQVVSKFVSRMMLDGKKDTCTKIIYEAMDKLKAKTGNEPLEVFLKALDNVKPVVEVKSRRVGGSSKLLVREADMEWQIHFLLNFWMLSITLVQHSKRRKIHTKWLKLTKLLLISAGSIYNGRKFTFLPFDFLKSALFKVLFFIEKKLF